MILAGSGASIGRFLNPAFNDPFADGIAGKGSRIVDMEFVHQTGPVFFYRLA